ncbi:MAG: hypothetical protein G3I10_03485 [Ferrovum sp.]|nr:hypothetical protein [Ferrovum sp.]
MIALNTEKGLVKIESWDDVLSRPGFKVDIDPKSIGLKAIIGRYVFKDFVACGLSTCHQPHGRGYLVVLEDGHETNIGNRCGKTHFSVDFESLRRRFDRDFLDKTRRERLTVTLHQLPAIKKRIASLTDEQGGNKVHKRLHALISPSDAVPHAIVNRMKQLVRARDGALKEQRLATAEERELRQARGERLPSGPLYVEETTGTIEGLAALYPENNLRTLLIERLFNPLIEFSTVDVDLLGQKELVRWSKWVESIEPTLQTADAALCLGKRLLIESNLLQLLPILTSRADANAFKTFVTGQ